MPKPSIQVSIHGRRFGLGPKSELIFNDANAGLQDARVRPMATARRVLTNAEVLALNATPIELVAAPGAGKVLLPNRLSAYKAAGTAYTAGDTVATLTVDTVDDALVEADERYRVALSNPNSPTGAAVTLGANREVTTTITDNDSAVVTVAATNDGAETGPVDGRFTVSLSLAASSDTLINYALGGTATGGSDFAALPGQVTILAGDTTATIDVPVIDDPLVEGT